jgi:hypothetical protein
MDLIAAARSSDSKRAVANPTPESSHDERFLFLSMFSRLVSFLLPQNRRKRFGDKVPQLTLNTNFASARPGHQLSPSTKLQSQCYGKPSACGHQNTDLGDNTSKTPHAKGENQGS